MSNTEEFPIGQTANGLIEIVLVGNEKEIRIRCEDDKEFAHVMHTLQEEQQSYEFGISNEYSVSGETASAIAYLRSRSRWTEEKEQHLVELDHAGKKLPDVYSGEF